MTAPIPLPRAADRYDRSDQDRLRASLDQRLTNLESKENTSYLSGDRGDASVTLNAGRDMEVQMFETELTMNRTVTLGTGFSGARFRIVRTGLGAFTLDVGGLKTIPSATAAFVDVGHDGSGWKLTGYGTL